MDAFKAIKQSISDRTTVTEADKCAPFDARRSSSSGRDHPARLPEVASEPVALQPLLTSLKNMLTSADDDGGHPDAKVARRFGEAFPEAASMRRMWHRIARELESAHSLAVWSAATSSRTSQEQLFDALCEAIAAAAHKLIDGPNTCHRSSPPAHRSDLKQEGTSRARAWLRPLVTASTISVLGSSEKTLSVHPLKVSPTSVCVWSSLREARRAVIREALAARFGYLHSAPIRAAMAGAPAIIVVVERVVTASSAEALDGLITPLTDQCDVGVDEYFSGWLAASLGVAVLVTVLAESPEHMPVAVENALGKSVSESSLAPVLVVVHASPDSVLTSGLTALRSVCDSHNARLCVEGPALALIAQPDRPVDPSEAVAAAHAMLLDPGAWFGFSRCAVISMHNGASLVQPATLGSDIESEDDAAVDSSRDERLPIDGITVGGDGIDRVQREQSLLYSHDDDSATATGPAMALWVLLSRLGLSRMRILIDEATTLAERFINELVAVVNMEAQYAGVGCVVRMTYALSRGERVMRKYKAREHISNVNKAIYSQVEDKSHMLLVQLCYQDGQAYLQFSPCQALCSGALWMPSPDAVSEYVLKLREAANMYESCSAGSTAFADAIAKCLDIELATDKEVGPLSAMYYGAFRVVPHEMRASWRDTSDSLDMVQDLTDQLVSQLGETVNDLLSHSPHFKTRIANCKSEVSTSSIYTASGAGDRNLRNAGAVVDDADMPFLVFLHSRLSNDAPNFMSLEPRAACKPADAVRYAKLGAELVLAAVGTIANQWRGSSEVAPMSRDLVNVAGIEDFVVLTAPAHCSIRGESRAERNTRTPEVAKTAGIHNASAYTRKAKDVHISNYDGRASDLISQPNELGTSSNTGLDNVDPDGDNKAAHPGTFINLPSDVEQGMDVSGARLDLENHQVIARSRWLGYGENGRSNRRAGNSRRNPDSDRRSSGYRRDRDNGSPPNSEDDSTRDSEDGMHSESGDEDEDESDNLRSEDSEESEGTEGTSETDEESEGGRDMEEGLESSSTQEFVTAQNWNRNRSATEHGSGFSQKLLGWFRRGNSGAVASASSGDGPDDMDELQQSMGVANLDSSDESSMPGSEESEDDENAYRERIGHRNSWTSNDSESGSEHGNADVPGASAYARNSALRRSKPEQASTASGDDNTVPSVFGFRWLRQQLESKVSAQLENDLSESRGSSESQSATSIHSQGTGDSDPENASFRTELNRDSCDDRFASSEEEEYDSVSDASDSDEDGDTSHESESNQESAQSYSSDSISAVRVPSRHREPRREHAPVAKNTGGILSSYVRWFTSTPGPVTPVAQPERTATIRRRNSPSARVSPKQGTSYLGWLGGGPAAPVPKTRRGERRPQSGRR